MSDGNSSTLGSYVNAGIGAAQRAVGSVTGDSSAQVRSPTSALTPTKNTPPININPGKG